MMMSPLPSLSLRLLWMDVRELTLPMATSSSQPQQPMGRNSRSAQTFVMLARWMEGAPQLQRRAIWPTWTLRRPPLTHLPRKSASGLD